MNQPQDIFTFIEEQENNFKLPIDLMGWTWNFGEHVKTAFYYKHSRLLTGNADDKPVRNIIRPILNVQYRTEDIDVRDVNLYIDNPDKYHESLLVKKYYEEVFLKKNNLDSFLDEANESRVDYGGALLKDVGEARPEVVPLDSLAFCDQTDILSGPIGIKHFFSPDQLMDMEKKGWGDKKNGATITLEELVFLAQDSKQDDKFGTINKTPGKYIEVYEVHGNMPEKFLKETDSLKYATQMQIVAFYTKQDGGRSGVILFRGKEDKSPFKLILRDPIHGRALGFGGVEELVEAQVWTNYSQIKFRQLLDAASDTLLQTDDDALATNRRVYDFEGKRLAVVETGKQLTQVDTFPRNINLFNQYTEEWAAHAQQMGAANDSIMGEKPNAGTPFKLQELITKESHSLHEFRRGKFAKDIEGVYRDWILPFIEREIKKDQEFLATLTLDEMQFMADKIVNKQLNDLLGTGQIDAGEVEAKRMELREAFMKDNKKFISWTKDEFKDVSISLDINIAGKQKDLYLYTDKLVNVFRQIAAAPQMLDDPRMAKIFNQILTSAGLEPVDFTTFRLPTAQAMPVASTEPMQALTNNQQL